MSTSIAGARTLSEPQLALLHLTHRAGDHHPRLAAVSIWPRPFDIDTFAESVNRVSSEYLALRSAIDVAAGKPAWVEQPGTLPSIVVAGGGPRAADILADVRRQPFVMHQAPLIRFVVVERDSTVEIHTVSHPAVLDRVAIATLHQQLRAQYTGEATEHTATTRQPPAAIVEASPSPERGSCDGNARTADITGTQAERWADDFADFVPSTPAFWAHGYAQDAEASAIRLRLPDDVTARLARFAASCGISMADAALTAHVKAVSLATGRFDIAVGVEAIPSSAGTAVPVGARCITVPVRVRTGSGTWAELSREVSTARDRAARSADRSLLRLHHELRLDRILDTTCAVTDLSDPWQVPGTDRLPAEHIDFSAPFDGVCRVDILYHLGRGQLTLQVGAGPGFTAGQAQELLQLHVRVFSTIEASACHQDVPALDSDQEVTVLHRWNGRSVAYPPPYCVHELFEQQARRTPDALAVVGPREQLTYQELNERSNQLAHQLRADGTAVGSVVGIYARRDISMIVAFLAVLKSGAAYLPLEPGQPSDRILYLLQDAGASTVLTDAAYHAQVPDGSWKVRRMEVDHPLREPVTNLGRTSSPQDLMYVIYTSGSTGVPKGVEVPHYGVVNYLRWCVQEYARHGDGGAALFSSVAFDMVVPNIYTPLIMGQRVCVLDETLDTGQVARRLSELAPFSFLKLTPGQLAVLGELLTPEQARSLAHFLVVGADAFPVRIMHRWRRVDAATPMINEYGPTEASVGNCVHTVTGDEAGESLPIGRPIPNTTMYVLDGALRPVPVGVPGELYIGGACVVRGYTGKPHLTEEKFLPDPFSSVPDVRMYRTGDIGRWLPSGLLEFLGRIDDQVKIRGYRVEPAEVEAVLAAHPSVDAAVVTVIGKTRATFALAGYYVSPDGLDPAEARDHLSRHLPDYLVPSQLHRIPAVPLNANGKVDRKALPAQGAGRAAQRRQQAALDGPAGEALRAAWTTVFGHSPAGTDEQVPDDDMFSANVIRLATLIAGEGAVALPAAFRLTCIATTFGDMAELLDQSARKPGSRP
ncbi:amino acid adenylation domain-containing protein [Micromonospora profundi]|uniref:non-ribosomal peptide synthetase n=1 Tax=Micromonospora profundi TaxID=1420889 RepID=UPI00365F73EE